MRYETQYAKRESIGFNNSSDSVTLTFSAPISSVVMVRLHATGVGQVYLGKRLSCSPGISGCDLTVSVRAYGDSLTVSYSIVATVMIAEG